MSHRKTVRRFGFTLIELLVVVAIMGILASLLLPALARAKYQTKTAVCIGNLKQAGAALTMYCDDYDGFYPVIQWDLNEYGGFRYKSQVVREYDIMKTYFGGLEGMKGIMTCAHLQNDMDAQYGGSYNYPYRGANSVPLSTYMFRYHMGRSTSNYKVPMRRQGDMFQVGSNGNGVRDKWFDIVANDAMHCRDYGYNITAAGAHTGGLAVAHVPFGMASMNFRIFHAIGHELQVNYGAYNANFLYSDGHVEHKGTLTRLGTWASTGNFQGTYETIFPVEDARE